jgi:hypothetical protein
MIAFCREHGLSLALGAGWIGFGLAAACFEPGWARDRIGGMGDGAFGALCVVLLTKWLRERGSPASK